MKVEKEIINNENYRMSSEAEDWHQVIFILFFTSPIFVFNFAVPIVGYI